MFGDMIDSGFLRGKGLMDAYSKLGSVNAEWDTQTSQIRVLENSIKKLEKSSVVQMKQEVLRGF